MIPTWSLVSLSCWAVYGTDKYEESWRSSKNWPQYKYIARPIYKYVASKTNPIFATAVSFFVTDLIIHQLLRNQVKCLYNQHTFCSQIDWSPICSLAWMAMGIPVMYAKYRSNMEKI